MPTHYNPRLEEEKKRREEKIAQSRASANPIQQAAPAQHAQVQQRGPSPLAQAGIGIGKKLLGSALGPLGGVLGGLFNTGGPVHPHAKKDYNMHAGQGHMLNTGGKIDYAEEARKRVAAQNAAIKAGAQGQNVAPLQRRLFDEQGNSLGQIQGDVIKGYACLLYTSPSPRDS